MDDIVVEHGSAKMGEGGCLVKALYVLNMLGSSEHQVSQNLNLMGEPTLVEINAIKKSTWSEDVGDLQLWDMSHVMKADYWWHPLVVKNALEMFYGSGHYIWKKVTIPFRFDPTKKYVVEGILRPEFQIRGILYQHGGWNIPYVEEEWRHCVAVKKNKFFCGGLPGRPQPVEVLLENPGSYFSATLNVVEVGVQKKRKRGV